MNSTRTARKTDIRAIVEVAVCAALLAVCSWITVPFMNIPFTMQTFGVFFIIRFLGGKKGTLAIAIYILLGLLGLPVFAGFAGGLSAIVSYTGGYIVGFLFMGLIWWATEKIRKHAFADYLVMTLALLVCYAFGTVWFMIYSGTSGFAAFGSALAVCVVPYLPFDTGKLILAVFVSGRVKKALGVSRSSEKEEGSRE